MRVPCRLSLAVPLLLAFPLIAAESPDSRQTGGPATQQFGQIDIPTLRVFSRETIVDVVVTDSKGHAVRDLERSDFTIEEDGKPQPIRSFTESGVALARGNARELPPLFHTNYKPTPLTGPVNIILIDGLHLNFAMTARALQATAAYARSMPEGTQVD
jgi:VWFA-related protein